MVATKDIAWVAGLLEGEGCFSNRSGRYFSPQIQLMMTDKDVVIRAAHILGAHKVVQNKNPTKAGKPVYRMNLGGRRALEWMLTIYVLMGERRRAKLRELFARWRTAPSSPYPMRKSYSRGGAIVWRAQPS